MSTPPSCNMSTHIVVPIVLAEVFSSDKKLYELEEQFKDSSFVRISKACILNIDHLDSVKVLINGRLEARLLNGEKLIINRHYVSAFKKKLG